MCLHVLEILWASTTCSPRDLSRAVDIALFYIDFCVVICIFVRFYEQTYLHSSLNIWKLVRIFTYTYEY